MPRDGAGNFTLAPGNPVVPGTVIEAAWANPTLSDIAANITDSLSRTGQGGMLVPFRNTDGVVGAPGMTWANEPSSGWYRAGLNDFWYSVGNENIFRITKTSIELAPGKNFIGLGPLSLTSLTIASGIIVASAPALNVTQTWNNAAVQFVGKDTDITDTASLATSILERWRVGGVEKFSIGKAGNITAAGTATISGTGLSSIAGALKITGQNPGGIGALAGVIDYGNAAGMRLFSYGPNAATNGIFTLNSQRSDGSNSIDVLLTDTSGNATFAKKLAVTGDGSVGIDINVPSNTNALRMSSWTVLNWVGNSAQVGGVNAGQWTALTLFTHGSPRIAIKADGTTQHLNPSYFGNNILDGSYLINIDNNAGCIIAKNSNAGSRNITIWNAGTVGNNTFLSFGTEAGYTERGQVIYNRGAGTVDYQTTSDERAKTVEGAYKTSGADIDAVPIYLGKMNGALFKMPMLVAHELQRVAPYAVTGERGAVNDKGEPIFQQVSHASLIPLLWAEVQSLRTRVAALEI